MRSAVCVDKEEWRKQHRHFELGQHCNQPSHFSYQSASQQRSFPTDKFQSSRIFTTHARQTARSYWKTHYYYNRLMDSFPVRRYQKGKTGRDLNEARGDGVLGWQWHQLDHMQTSTPHCRQITTPTPRHSIFTGCMPFLTPKQQCQSTEGIWENWSGENGIHEFPLKCWHLQWFYETATCDNAERSCLFYAAMLHIYF